MKGYQVTFFLQQDRRHGRQQMHEWLMQTAKSLGIRGSTAVMAAEGYGHSGKRHSMHFFELADQPIEVTIAMDEGQAQALFEVLEREKANLFYVKSVVEFGTVGGAQG
ncbi:DUF190 domain-containing protein [Methylibium sp.]|uniref:DUF190 domain-containing protein n=1 Tax=Methylibium sp. TaxID=2067992 RepID=UPI003D0E6D23